MKKILKKYFLLICMILISILKFLLTQKLPIKAFTTEVYDDQLMVYMAKNIMLGNWLGDFNSNTFIKGIGFPMFLCIIKFLNISYLFAVDLLYCLACAYFIYAIKDSVKNNIARLIIFTVMLFNPISYAEMTFQRVYRNGVGVFQTIFIFSGIYIIYKNRNMKIKNLILHIVLVSVNMAFLWHTREDGIWIMPFVMVSILMIVIFMLIENIRKKGIVDNSENIEKFTKRKMILRIFTFCMPLWILIISTNCIKIVNNHYYGAYIERSGDNFSKVQSLFYKVKANEEIQYVDNTREKINRIYEVSETLNSIKPELEESLDIWDMYDRNPGDGEVENGWFMWALKHAVQYAGKYTSASEAEDFYGKICEEIEIALKNGELEKNEGFAIGALPLWKEGDGKEILQNFGTYLSYVFKFSDIEVSNAESREASGVEDLKISDFEFVTSNSAVERSSTNVRICGWYFFNNKENFKIYLTNEKQEKIAEITRIESQDLVQIFNLNSEYNYRFDFSITDIEKIVSYNELYISIYDENENLQETIGVNDYVQDQIIENDISTFSISMFVIDKNIDPSQSYSNFSVKVLNKIIKIYAVLGMPIAIFSIICYFIITIFMIVKSIKEKKLDISFNVWILLTGIFLSFLVLLIGIIYTGIKCCDTLIYMYLAVAYPLFIMFAVFSIANFLKLFTFFKKMI